MAATSPETFGTTRPARSALPLLRQAPRPGRGGHRHQRRRLPGSVRSPRTAAGSGRRPAAGR
ncbi:hypothetical protein LUW77_25480 [Streptomyces radiopugnans]|nr:hypothetical protein LUW77_25480 [Streptomyces radiopugnans]